MYVNVNIRVRSSIDQTPLAGVTVRVLNRTTLQTRSTGTTDSQGIAAFVLPANTSYEVRYFLEGAKVPQPTSLTLAESDVEAEAQVQPPDPHTSVDSRVCVVYGHLLGAGGLPIRTRVKIKPAPEGQGALYAGGYHALFQPGGFAEHEVTVQGCHIPLLRGVCYDVMLHLLEDTTLRVKVPDAANVNLTDLLWPYLKELSFEPAYSPAFSVGEFRSYILSGIRSDANAMDMNGANLLFVSSNPSVVTVEYGAGTLTMRAVGSGTAEISVTEYDPPALNRVPTPAIAPFPIQVTVS